MNDVFTDDTLEHRCADGHYWRRHANGQVTPSWGMGGTYIDVDDAAVCPEPATDRRGLYDCRSCGQKHRPGAGLGGLSFTPWEYGDGGRQECEIPQPGCGKPPAWTRRWGDRDLPWRSGGPGALYTLWWIARRNERERLVAFLHAYGQTKTVIDLHSGELLQVACEDRRWDPGKTRKATTRDLPEALLAVWPTKRGKPIPAGFDDKGEAPDSLFFMRHTNPEYMALSELRDQGRLKIPDAEREFMWAVEEAYRNNDRSPSTPSPPPPIAEAVRRRAAKRRWPIRDVDGLLADLDARVDRIRAERNVDLPPPTVQLALAL